MSTTNDGGPAFPASGMLGRGMTLRDYFAGCELKKIEGAYINDEPGAYDNLAKHCYRMADAMLAARESKVEGGAA